MDVQRERALLNQCRNNRAAFRELYLHYFPKVYAYMVYRVSDIQDAEDLVAKAFLNAIENLDGFEHRGESSFGAWLFRIAHNLTADYYREQHRSIQQIPMDSLPELQAGEQPPEGIVLRHEQINHLRSLISTLSPRRQEVIILRFFAGLHNTQIAEILSLDQRTVASHLCRGLEELHDKYVDELGKREVSGERME